MAHLLSNIPNADDLKLNQIQVIGTHNSYHIQPFDGINTLLEARGQKELARAWEYTHLPLTKQLDNQGIRQLELDIFADPDGGLYANPIGYQLALANNLPVGPEPNLDGILERPGLKVLHIPDLDFRSTTPTFLAALKEIDAWSDANPEHVPILVLVEAKDEPIPSTPDLTFTTPLLFDAAALDTIDAEIRSVFTENEILTPNDVRGDFATLNEAVLNGGWPTLEETQGQILFALDNTGEVRERYIDGYPSLEGRVMFVDAPVGSAEAAFLKRNNPFDPSIPELVAQGYLVRTRADADTVEARINDTTRRDTAFASGAQFISTDYPEPNPGFSDYAVVFPDESTVRVNPLTGGKLTPQTETVDLGFRLPSSSSFNDLTIKLTRGKFPRPLGSSLQGTTPEREIIDLRGQTAPTVNATIEVFRESDFNNAVGIYTVEDEQGSVKDPLTGNLFKPGSAGYLQTALANRVDISLTGQNEQTITYNFELLAGKLLSTFLVVNEAIETLLDTDTSNDPTVYFNYIAANSDGVDHMRLLGDNVFGYEDIAGGGDMDFDDVIVKISLT